MKQFKESALTSLFYVITTFALAGKERFNILRNRPCGTFYVIMARERFGGEGDPKQPSGRQPLEQLEPSGKTELFGHRQHLFALLFCRGGSLLRGLFGAGSAKAVGQGLGKEPAKLAAGHGCSGDSVAPVAEKLDGPWYGHALLVHFGVGAISVGYYDPSAL